jgi:sec-independent protein translocase protein TatA
MTTVLLFLNLGGGEVFVVILVVLLLFGSDQLPQLLKGVGKGIREINDAKSQIQNEIKKGTGVSLDELQKQTTIIKEEVSQVKQTVKRQVNSFVSENNSDSKPVNLNPPSEES